MTRSIAAFVAFIVLIGLTVLTWLLADGGASAWLLSGVAAVKIAIIGAVFLELLRSWPLWTAIYVASAAVVLVGAAGLIWMAGA